MVTKVKTSQVHKNLVKNKKDMKEVHFVFGNLGAKRFIIPIAESFKGNFEIYCQLANKDKPFSYKNV